MSALIPTTISKSVFLLAPVLLMTASASLARAESRKWENLAPSPNGSTIQFQSTAANTTIPQPLNLTPLKDLTVISWLKPSGDATPYLLLSGSSPEDNERSLFIVRADGKLKPQRLTFPGKLLDPKTRETVHESRAFFGRCLASQEHDALVLYQRDRLDRRRGMHSSVYVAEAAPDLLSERVIERRLPSMKTVQQRIKIRQCTEISGKNRSFDAAFFQFRNRGAELPDTVDVDEDKNDQKESKDETSLGKSAP
ncbi:MAG: hypothetical protein KGQ59_04655 [Bdellovibrionales bacterium]|nr:hypothetical protein [Bdellovibrionales bacterium]